MRLSTGEKLGSYEILSAIGAGGMGEVYKARDTRLDRTVAIKVLPEHIGKRDDLRARFEREARAVASLNHPHICTLHDIGNHDGAGYMVMEYMEGETLAARIEKGALPLDQVLKFAMQIADALDRAHRAGVTHRDVKPPNIMLTRDGVKVLDFGLAKSSSKPALPEATVTSVLTTEGTVMGTPQYMAPEQFEGKDADARSDIWAFGAVLYEMVTGEKAFHGESYSSLVRAILSADPAPMAAKPFTPAWLERLVRRCLAKDPEERYYSMHDVVLDLRTPVAESAAAGPSKAARWLWAVAAASALIAIALGWRVAHPPEAPLKPLVRLDADLGPDAITAGYNTFAISPDGERLVFTIRGADGKIRLATRLLSDAKPTILEETENPQNPFFSPDGAWIAYTSDGKLRRVSTLGGAPVVICEALAFYGGTWIDERTLVVSLSHGTALARVAAAGGSPKPIGKLSGSHITQRWPQALPGGEYVLASASGSKSFESATIIAVSTKTGEARRLVEGGYSAHYVAGPVAGEGSSTGHLLYMRGASLFAVGFDPTKLEIKGDAVPVADQVGVDLVSWAGHWDVSRNGVLLHRRGRPTAMQTYPVVWMDRTGQTRPLVSEHQVYHNMRFSPDGNRLALSVHADGGADMFVYDLTRDTTSRLTSSGMGKHLVTYSTWTQDGKHIISHYPGPSGFGLAWYRADGGGEPQILLDSSVVVVPTSVSPDGKRIAYTRVDPVSLYDIWVLPLDTTDPEHPKAGKPEVFLQSPASEGFPAFSPDGRWVAYQSSETGRSEAYVRPYLRPNQAPGGKWQVSKDGGRSPLWSADGRSLYFLSPDRHIMVVDYEVKGDVLSPGKARQWSPVPIGNPPSQLPYALHPDGKRFAVFAVPQTAPEEKGNAHVTFLLNFGDELRRRLPPGK